MKSDVHQQQIQEEADIMRALNEAKNETISKVQKLINDLFVTNNKLLSAGMSR